MPTVTLPKRPATAYESLLPTGRWRVDADRSSAEFTARLIGRSVRGQVPLTGEVAIASRIEDSTAHFVAATQELNTGHGVLDRALAGSGFLDTGRFPQIAFRSQTLVCVPTGWRAIGQLHVKGREHPVVCELAADLRHPDPAAAGVTLTSRWVLDSTWITEQRVPTLSRRVEMVSRLVLSYHPD